MDDPIREFGDTVRHALAMLPGFQEQADALHALAQLERECRRAAALAFVIEKGLVASSRDRKCRRKSITLSEGMCSCFPGDCNQERKP